MNSGAVVEALLVEKSAIENGSLKVEGRRRKGFGRKSGQSQ